MRLIQPPHVCLTPPHKKRGAFCGPFSVSTTAVCCWKLDCLNWSTPRAKSCSTSYSSPSISWTIVLHLMPKTWGRKVHKQKKDRQIKKKKMDERLTSYVINHCNYKEKYITLSHQCKADETD